MAKENAVMGRIGLIYNHDRSIECRIQCTEVGIQVFGKIPENINCVIGWVTKFFPYHPALKEYKKLLYATDR